MNGAMHHMKKILAAALAVCLIIILFCFCGCQSSDKPGAMPAIKMPVEIIHREDSAPQPNDATCSEASLK